MTDPSQIDVFTETARNVFHMRFHGQVTAPGLAAVVPVAEQQIAALPPGFSVLTDLSDLESMELECVPSLTKVMDQLRKSRPRLIVRIIPNPDKDIGFNLLSIIHYRGDVQILTCETRAEADRALSS
jgi:hypothetical protein